MGFEPGCLIYKKGIGFMEKQVKHSKIIMFLLTLLIFLVLFLGSFYIIKSSAKKSLYLTAQGNKVFGEGTKQSTWENSDGEIMKIEFEEGVSGFKIIEPFVSPQTYSRELLTNKKWFANYSYLKAKKIYAVFHPGDTSFKKFSITKKGTIKVFNKQELDDFKIYRFDVDKWQKKFREGLEENKNENNNRQP